MNDIKKIPAIPIEIPVGVEIYVGDKKVRCVKGGSCRTCSLRETCHNDVGVKQLPFMCSFLRLDGCYIHFEEVKDE